MATERNKVIKVLLVEDNPADQKLVRIYLKEARMKHELHVAETLYESYEIAEEIQPDVALLDLTLPDSTGFKTISSYLERKPKHPVIVLTGMDDEVVGNQAVKAGAQDFLVKGEFEGKLLGRIIRYSLQRYHTQYKLEETARSLAISEKRFLEAQEMAHFGNFEVDLVTNQMSWSDEMFRIFGFLPRSISPSVSDYLNYTHFEDRSMVEDFFEKAAKDGQRHEIEHRILLNGRTVKYVQIYAKAFYEELNSKLLLVGGIQDINQRKINEKLLIEKNLSTRSSKIKEEILEDMSFHIRTPLSSILNLSFLLGKTEMNEEQNEFFQGLQTSVDDLAISVNNLMNFSLLVSEKITVAEENVNLDSFIQGLSKMINIKATQNKINLTFNAENMEDRTFKTDPIKLNQILYNLVDNAIKFSEPGSNVNVSFEQQQTGMDEFNLSIEITDEGKGMEPALVKRLSGAEDLLAVDYDTEEKQPLGLAIVNKLVHGLEGNLDIRSKPGEGSTFTVSIPVKVGQKPLAIKNSRPVSPLKILLVEDHFLNQIATKRLLTSWSDYVTVDIAENGLIGVEKFREHGYDLVLMDIQMPQMDGFEATGKIRERSEVPIIALTANATKQESENALGAGMNDYLPKPFKPEDLYLKIMNAIED